MTSRPAMSTKARNICHTTPRKPPTQRPVILPMCQLRTRTADARLVRSQPSVAALYVSITLRPGPPHLLGQLRRVAQDGLAVAVQLAGREAVALHAPHLLHRHPHRAAPVGGLAGDGERGHGAALAAAVADVQRDGQEGWLAGNVPERVGDRCKRNSCIRCYQPWPSWPAAQPLCLVYSNAVYVRHGVVPGASHSLSSRARSPTEMKKVPSLSLTGR